MIEPDLTGAHTRASMLLSAYADLAERGIEALAEGDLDRLDQALAARDAIIPELETVFGDARDASDDRRDVEQASAKVEFERLAHAARALDTRLRLALGAEHQRVEVELEQLDEDRTVRTAYGQKARRGGRQINLVR